MAARAPWLLRRRARPAVITARTAAGTVPQRRTLASSAGLTAAAAHWQLPDPDGVGSEMGAMSGPTVACNWLVPGRVLVGSYPAAPGNDSAHDEHLGLLLDAGVRLFVMLNAEVPRESDHDGRAIFERPWYRPYEADARRLADERGMGMFSVGFVHHPMKANTAGDEANTAALVGKIQQFVEAHDDKAVYIHCSGGHGRAGTVAACLLGALVPELTADESLAMTKAYHDTRHGLGHAEHDSPEAREQIEFVRRYHDTMRHEDGAVAGGGDPDLSAGGYRR